VAHTLTAGDRFSLVAYSTEATVALAPTVVDKTGLVLIEAAITALAADGQTNLWGGLHEGLKLLTDG
jgi:hypothetical protein